MMRKRVKDETGQIVTDHRLYDGWQTTEPVERAGWGGECFVARVTGYEKGSKGFREEVFAAPPQPIIA
jgi:hypothetical protein